MTRGLAPLLGLSAILLSACQSNEPLAFDPAAAQQQQAAAANLDRPAFYLEWKGGNLPGLTQKPQLDRSGKLPQYPMQSRRNREQGTTVLDACVTLDGRLADIHLSRSSGYPSLDEATVEWARQAKYKPAMFGDEALAVCGYKLEWVWDLDTGLARQRP